MQQITVCAFTMCSKITAFLCAYRITIFTARHTRCASDDANCVYQTRSGGALICLKYIVLYQKYSKYKDYMDSRLHGCNSRLDQLHIPFCTHRMVPRECTHSIDIRDLDPHILAGNRQTDNQLCKSYCQNT